MKKKMIYLAVAGFCLIALGFLGRYEYYRPNASLASAHPEYRLSADQLLHEFSAGEAAANRKYTGKVIEVNARISEISGGGKTPFTVTLAPDAGSSTVRCLMDTSIGANILTWPRNVPVTIKGLLIGYNRDETGLLGSDVDLTRCLPAGIGAGY